MKIVGIVLIAFGILALVTGGISYIDRDKVLDIGPLEAHTEERKTFPLSPIVGIVSVVAGVALIAVRPRSRV
jgi:hypothetical protein